MPSRQQILFKRTVSTRAKAFGDTAAFNETQVSMWLNLCVIEKTIP
jgi:hypothetical protein